MKRNLSISVSVRGRVLMIWPVESMGLNPLLLKLAFICDENLKSQLKVILWGE